MFKEKIPYEYKDPSVVSVRFTYYLQKFPNSLFVLKRKFAFADRPDDDANAVAATAADIGNTIHPNSILPFGVSIDPVRELVLYCKWLEVAENVVMDSRNYTDFDPMLSQSWSFRMHYEAVPNSFMRECLFEFLYNSDSMKSLADVIGAEYGYSATSELLCRGDEANPLERLTVSKITKITTSVLSAALSTESPQSGQAALAARKKLSISKKGKPMEGPLKDEQLMAMLYFLFPDAQEHLPNPYKIPSTDNVRKIL